MVWARRGAPGSFDGSAFKLQAPEPNPRRGGVLRYGVLNAPAHFDVHQSGTMSNMNTQGCMYDNLIRRNPLDSGQTIIPDLAHSWEISPDGRTYTFFLRKGVTFHDGADLTAEDVKATYQRIIRPPRGFSSPRTPLFATVSEINVRDSHTVEFRLSEPRPQNFMLGAFACGWNIIVRKQTLEDNDYSLRQIPDYPGTGPFRSVKRIDKEVWVMERNPDYWNEGLPYLDGIEFYHLPPFSPQLGAALLSGKIDYARLLDPASLQRVRDTPGMSGTDYYQSVIQAIWVNNEREAFRDPRVRRAIHLALDRAVLVDVVKDVAPMLVGGFIYPFSAFATPPDKLADRPGYQSDPTAAIREARQLMAAAGYADGIQDVDFMIREVASFKLWSVAIQAMLREILNIRTNLRAGAGVGVVRRGPGGQIRLHHQRHRVDADRSLGLLQRLVRQGRPAELLQMVQPPVPGPGAADRPRARRRQAQGPGTPGGGGDGAGPAADPRCRGRKSTTAGTTTSRATIRTTISASTTWCASIPSGWTNGCSDPGTIRVGCA